jgi:hypothetical protein
MAGFGRQAPQAREADAIHTPLLSVGADAKLSQVDGFEIRMLVGPIAIQMAQSKVGRVAQF